MGAFRRLATRMTEHKRPLVLAMVMAAVSAGGLGAGLLAITPVLSTILNEGGPDLPGMASRLNERIASMVGPWLAIPQPVIDALPTGRFNAVLGIVLALGVMTVIGATANFLHAYLSLTVVSRTIAGVRRSCFDRVILMPMRTVLASGPNDLVSRIVYDTQTLSSGLLALLSRGVAQVTKGAAALIVAFIIDWKLASISMVVGLFLGVIIRKLGTRIRRASRKALQAQADLYHNAGQALRALGVVKAYNAERAESETFGTVSDEVVRQELRVRTARALSSPLVEALAIIVLGGLSLVAAKAIIDGALNPASFITTLGALGIAGASLKPLTGIANDIQQAAAAADRITQLLDIAPEAGHEAGKPELPRGPGQIRFDAVALTYPGAEDPALREVTLDIPAGATVAVVGPNGSGKTTLLSLLPRLFDPDAGRVLIDGADIAGVSVRSLRERIGVVSQDTVLFRGTIAANIAYGKPGATHDQIEQAAKRARAHEFISARPGGYDAPVGEQGAGLSGGQRQRIAIARAILRDPEILILDEATSMVDADSEAQIAEAIAGFSKDRTCLIVAHRLATVARADITVVMDEGRVVGVGTHDELLDSCPTYRLIAEGQLAKARPEPAPNA